MHFFVSIETHSFVIFIFDLVQKRPSSKDHLNKDHLNKDHLNKDHLTKSYISFQKIKFIKFIFNQIMFQKTVFIKRTNETELGLRIYGDKPVLIESVKQGMFDDQF